jgi:hypothetical protein
MRTWSFKTKHGRITLSTDDAFTLQLHGRKEDGFPAGHREETTPNDLADILSLEQLVFIMKNGDLSEQEKARKAIHIAL